jgi:hypothetical protein
MKRLTWQSYERQRERERERERQRERERERERERNQKPGRVQPAEMTGLKL